MLKQHRVRTILGCLIFAIIAFGFGGQLSAARAQPQDGSYSITLTAEGSTTISYGNATSGFAAVFSHSVPLPGNGETVTLFVDQAMSPASRDPLHSFTDDHIYFNGIMGLGVGNHTVQARYYLTTTSTWIVSNTITITVGKGDSSISCNIDNLAHSYKPGQNITLDFMVSSSNGNVSVDWQNGTFTVIFNGPNTVTDAHQKANGNEQVTVHAPTTPGQYALVCNFDGSPLFNASGGYQLAALITQGQQTGPIQLYTNPTTVRANQPTTWYVVIPPANGLPTPTGTFNISVGNGSTRPIALSAAGDATVQLTAPTSVYGNITILYFGDNVYSSETASFSLTNPPIPGSGGNPGATPTPGAAKTPTTVPTSAGTPTPVISQATPVAGVSTTTNTSGGSGPGATPVVLSVLGLLVVGLGGAGGTLLWRRRTGAVLPSTPNHTWQQEPTPPDTL